MPTINPTTEIEVIKNNVEEILVLGQGIVLKFKAPEFQTIHEKWKEAGASWDYPDYIPHMSLFYIKEEVLKDKDIMKKIKGLVKMADLIRNSF